MFNDDDRYTYPPEEVPILTEKALVDRLDAQTGGEWWRDSGYIPMPDDGKLAVYTAQPSDPQRVRDLLAYIWTGPMRGEWWDEEPVVLIEGHLYVFNIDTTKSQRDDVPDAWDGCKGILSEGTPVRKTDKAGPGTKGTRAVEGLGPVLMAWR
jgi:hypothetical protein